MMKIQHLLKRKILFVGFLLGLFAGCTNFTPVRYSERVGYAKGVKKPTGKGLAIGTLLDKRFRLKDGRLDAKHVKMSMEEIRRIFLYYLDYSGRFKRIIQILPEFSGKKFSDLINSARKSDCDYLLVGEVSKFDIKFYGMNWRFIPAMILDGIILPLNLFVFVITAGESFIFSGGLIPVSIVEVRLSTNYNLVDVRTGRVVKSFTHSERVRHPATSFQMVGYFWDEQDDWVDLGRQLGSDVVHNMSAKMVDEIGDFMLEENK